MKTTIEVVKVQNDCLNNKRIECSITRQDKTTHTVILSEQQLIEVIKSNKVEIINTAEASLREINFIKYENDFDVMEINYDLDSENIIHDAFANERCLETCKLTKNKAIRKTYFNKYSYTNINVVEGNF